MTARSPTDEIFKKFVEEFIGGDLEKLDYVAQPPDKSETEYLRDVEYEVLDGLGSIRVKQSYVMFRGIWRVFNLGSTPVFTKAFVRQMDPEEPQATMLDLTNCDEVMIYRWWGDGSDSFADATETDKIWFLRLFGLEIDIAASE